MCTNGTICRHTIQYIDDVTIFTKGAIEQHFDRIKQIFQTLRDVRLKIKLLKSNVKTFNIQNCQINQNSQVYNLWTQVIILQDKKERLLTYHASMEVIRTQLPGYMILLELFNANGVQNARKLDVVSVCLKWTESTCLEYEPRTA
jgi:hypothetical protein